jgi:hypothetical protein
MERQLTLGLSGFQLRRELPRDESMKPPIGKVNRTNLPVVGL